MSSRFLAGSTVYVHSVFINLEHWTLTLSIAPVATAATVLKSNSPALLGKRDDGRKRQRRENKIAFSAAGRAVPGLFLADLLPTAIWLDQLITPRLLPMRRCRFDYIITKWRTRHFPGSHKLRTYLKVYEEQFPLSWHKRNAVESDYDHWQPVKLLENLTRRHSVLGIVMNLICERELFRRSICSEKEPKTGDRWTGMQGVKLEDGRPG